MRTIPFLIKAICTLSALFLFQLHNSAFGQMQDIAKERFENISNDTIKKEIASFTASGKQQSLSKKESLKAIPMYNCSDSFVTFSIGFFSSHSQIVSITGNPLSRRITDVHVVFHGKMPVNIPDSSFNDITCPNFCSLSKKKNLNFNVWSSIDKRRLYIQMLDNDNLQEVIWIIRNHKYCGRVIEKI